MPKHPYENLPKTEEIIYLDQNYQPQSFEEMSYKSDCRVCNRSR